MQNLPRLTHALASEQRLLELPEKAVQFGTGAFLRGFIEPLLDEANRRGTFGGRVVAIESTGSGRATKFNQQDGLYTLAVRGIQAGEPHREYKQIASLSRALSAVDEWDAVLQCARDPNIELVFSNTTEAGIRLDDDDIAAARLTAFVPDRGAPKSFPAKLTRFLFERAQAFNYDRARGVVVLPCELIENNGDRLKELVVELIERWSLGSDFSDWIEAAVPFCNTLVDRIVPGEPERTELEAAWNELGYRDELLTVTEVYRLYAIEADASVAARLRFTQANPSVIVAENITLYRQRKVRLLNGTHTIMTPVALMAGCETVAQAVQDERVGAFVQRVLFGELVPSTDVQDAAAFAAQAIDRFSNPFIRHELADITLQQTMKLRVRIVPAIADFAHRHGHAPAELAFGFAAFLLYVRDHESRADDHGDTIRELWKHAPDGEALVQTVCARTDLWGVDLSEVEGLVPLVSEALQNIEQQGMRAALDQHLAARQSA
jgi:tagaturonate reductase